jgi:hypothetical protein
MVDAADILIPVVTTAIQGAGAAIQRLETLNQSKADGAADR